MALVPFRVSGAAADQALEQRLFQIGGLTLSIRQDPRGSGAHRHLRSGDDTRAGAPADLGSGTGVVGIALALAGADTLLVDLPHVTPLTRANVEANCASPLVRAQVLEHAWGADVAPLGELPDLITGADVVYEPEHFRALLSTLEALAAPHTLIYLAFRLRGRGEDAFEGMLGERDFAVERVPAHLLHAEYQDGEYRVLRACKRGG